MASCPEGETKFVRLDEVPAPCPTEHNKPVEPEGELWTVCASTGLLPNDDCPTVNKRFTRGTEPKTRCTQHRSRRGNRAATEEVEICTATGLRANVNCPDIELRTFRKGQAPKGRCTTHAE